ncbi:hypothetical protein FOMPIDRAFT_89129 [Fomitopsis schrenkii]|uniref:F-box domain-containing protein n=1 Tax=Fomitopsis schrenkii TaxID=2126942 RepID=S8E375_FOMSC|nr:hypothetical protein FOMPIDRAFT_89129 [Fomitopsis schrenkii]
MPLLEEFKAMGSFDHERVDPLLRPSQALVALPHLRRMSLSQMRSYTASHLTKNLHTPSLSQLCIDLQYEGAFDLFEDLAAMLGPLISLAITREHSSSQRSTIRAYADVCELAKGSIESSAMSWMDTHAPVLEISGDFLLDSCTLLSAHDISSLILENALPPQTTWSDIARRIPSVTDLYILNAEPINLPTMLSTSISEGDESSAEGHAPGYVLPRLRTLTLEAARFPPMYPPSPRWGRSSRQAKAPVGFLDTLISCLAIRRQGGTAIEKLRVLHPNEMSQMTIDKLSQVVPSTEWDGVSGASALDALHRSYDSDHQNLS